MKTQKRKQVSLDSLSDVKFIINDLLSSKIPQFAKQKLCIAMEKLLNETGGDQDDYQLLYYAARGKSEGYSPSFPGPNDTGKPDFVSDVEGLYSRRYKV